MRIASVGHAAFAAAIIALGILGLIHGNLPPVWDPLPNGVPAREALVYLCASISLVCGIGLLWRRTAAGAARLLLACLLLWLLLFRVPFVMRTPTLSVFFSLCDTAVVAAAAWVLYHWFAAEWDRKRLGFASDRYGLRIARTLYSLALIFYGSAHFIDIQDTIALVPGWLLWHLFWAYFFGCTFIAAGIAVLVGVFARLAAALSTVQLGLFTLLVWVPIVAAGPANAFQRSETVLSAVLTTAAWVLADSYRSPAVETGPSI